MGRHADNNSDSILIREILKKLVSLEQEIEKLKSKPEYHINVEYLEVQQLESLIFRLDALDIKDLSGTLNIGNNFGTGKNPVKAAEKSRKSHKGKKTSAEKEES